MFLFLRRLLFLLGQPHPLTNFFYHVKALSKRQRSRFRAGEYHPWFQLFWFRGDAAFANPKVYEYCKDGRYRVAYSIQTAFG